MSCETSINALVVSAKFLGADDYRLDPSHNPPYTKYDDVEANEKQEFRFMNIY